MFSLCKHSQSSSGFPHRCCCFRKNRQIKVLRLNFLRCCCFRIAKKFRFVRVAGALLALQCFLPTLLPHLSIPRFTVLFFGSLPTNANLKFEHPPPASPSQRTSPSTWRMWRMYHRAGGHQTCASAAIKSNSNEHLHIEHVRYST